ncbi:MAG: transcriptional regulatory protein [Xanthobacteraceae bacterium]|jgi:LuxR family quorum sensing-dependent transcriptional regulator|nr:transcriptional regulatory protein [Xanthobacteraceae bacterium]
MAFEGDTYGQRTLDFVERLQQLTEYDEICQHIMKEMEWFGFSCVSSFSIPGPGENLKASIQLNNRPQEYTERYVEKNYVVHDPAVTELRKTIHPYSWSDIRKRRVLKKSEKLIMDEATEFGARDGFIIPIVTISGSAALFCPCGLEPDLSPRARAAVEIIGIYSHHALQRALVHKQREEAAHTPLTPREREIMQWVASGKTDDEIADILSVGTSTVTSHVENAKKKLDAFRRTYAVVQAIRSGEISL